MIRSTGWKAAGRTTARDHGLRRRHAVLGAGLALLAGAAGALSIGRHREARAGSAQARRLADAADMAAVGEMFADAGTLPPPVRRYLQWALGSVRSLRIVRMHQVGELRTDLGTDRWLEFSAQHLVAPGATGFLWNARVRLGWGLHVQVRDAFVEGRGSSRVSLLSALPVAADEGRLETNAGSLHRFLAEAVWYPTALLPGPALRWEPIDEGRALATLTSHDVSVSLEFRFAPSGEVTGIYTPARWGRFGDGYEERPWEGRFWAYRQRRGLWVPSGGEVGWYDGADWRSVWTGTVVEYDIE